MRAWRGLEINQIEVAGKTIAPNAPCVKLQANVSRERSIAGITRGPPGTNKRLARETPPGRSPIFTDG